MPDNRTRPESLLLVRSTLEMAAQLRRLYPAQIPLLIEIETQVLSGGQLLLAAGSIPRAKFALQTIQIARSRLQEMAQNQISRAA